MCLAIYLTLMSRQTGSVTLPQGKHGGLKGKNDAFRSHRACHYKSVDGIT